jgi:hypothetical protein
VRAALDRVLRFGRLGFRVRVETNVSTADDKRLGWGSLFKALGSLGGLAALTYLIGLVPYWIRLSSVGYPADVALQVANQQQILQQGLGPALIWTAITAASAVILLCSLSTTIAVHRKDKRSIAERGARLDRLAAMGALECHLSRRVHRF